MANEVKLALLLTQSGVEQYAKTGLLDEWRFSVYPIESAPKSYLKIREISVSTEEVSSRDEAVEKAVKEIEADERLAMAEHQRKMADFAKRKQDLLALPAPVESKPAEDVDFDDTPF